MIGWELTGGMRGGRKPGGFVTPPSPRTGTSFLDFWIAAGNLARLERERGTT